MNTSHQSEQKSHLGAWIFASVVVAGIAVCVVVALWNHNNSPAVKTDNTQALQSCITAVNNKYDAIITEATATQQPNALSLISAKANDVKTCQAEYPVN